METTFNYQDFSQYLDGIEEQISPRQVLTGVDTLLADIEEDLDGYNEQVTGASEETKRKLATEAIETYDLNLLARDENFNVRTLALCNPHASPAILDQAVDDASSSGDKYTLMIVANNPSANLSTLNKIFDFGDGELEIKDALLANPHTDDILRFKIEGSQG
jgi:hypothetical protein